MKVHGEISKSGFKAHALEILRGVEKTGQPVIITDRGRQALVLKKYVAHETSPLQLLKGSVLRYDDPLAPVAEGDWDALK